MSSKKKPRPRLLVADENGNIFDHPSLHMVCRRGGDFAEPRPDEYIPLPEESELFLLPGRFAVGLDPETGQLETLEENAVAAFVCPGHTLTGSAAYETGPDAPILPMFAYGAVGYANGRMWVAAKKVDEDRRQIFTSIPRKRIESGARALMRAHPDNRLIRHLSVCALTYGCPAARNLALGRYEAPLPTARTCNARCLGCISKQPEDSGFSASQERITFTPTPEEIAEVMTIHSAAEKRPVLSFGQGCEGEPLTEARAIGQGVRLYRQGGGTGTVNVNTNGSLPDALLHLAECGIDSIRVSLNSATPALYEVWYRPVNYAFEDVRETIKTAKANGLFVSLNLLFFPGVTDTEGELESLAALVEETGLDYIQLRNLNLDPEIYLEAVKDLDHSPIMGFNNWKKRLAKTCPHLGFGYFNPPLKDRKRDEPY